MPKSSNPLEALTQALSQAFVAFDWATFFSSPSGLVIIAAFGVTLGLSLKYYISVSRKMGNWVWL